MAPRERPAEFAILGLLTDAESGSHGYDLARAFAPGESLGEILRLEPGMLYHHLKRLERAGFVSQSTSQPGSRPPRQNYRLTEQGRDRLLDWLQSPVEHTREIRLDFLVKLYFAKRHDPRLAEHLIDTQLSTLKEMRATLSDRQHSPDDFLDSVIRLRLTQTEAAITWLESVQGSNACVSGQASGSDMP